MSLMPTRQEERPVERWDPFRQLEDVHRQMEAWLPLVDVEETDDAWIIEADVPAAKREDITVELQGDELAIHGEIKERERVGILRRRTRRTGQFDYRVHLPGDIDEDAIRASVDSGVLTVRVPKSERARRRRIEIKAG